MGADVRISGLSVTITPPHCASGRGSRAEAPHRWSRLDASHSQRPSPGSDPDYPSTTLPNPASATGDEARSEGAFLHTTAGDYHIEQPSREKDRPAPGGGLRPLDTTIPGDLSSASFLLVAALLVPGSEVDVESVGINPTRTGLLDVLRQMGADVTVHEQRQEGGEPVADVTARSSTLRATEVGGDTVVRMIDEFPLLAVAATQAEGTTIVHDAAELRVKETDRIAVIAQELGKMGATIEPRPDGFTVRGPTPLRAAVVDSHGDHRIAMALVVAGLLGDGATILRHPTCIQDSFPGFIGKMRRMGASIS